MSDCFPMFSYIFHSKNEEKTVNLLKMSDKIQDKVFDNYDLMRYIISFFIHEEKVHNDPSSSLIMSPVLPLLFTFRTVHQIVRDLRKAKKNHKIGFLLDETVYMSSMTMISWAKKMNCLRYTNEKCAYAAFIGDLEMLKWLRDQDPPYPWDTYTCESAAKGGHVHVLEWLRHKDRANSCHWDEGTTTAAAKNGHLDVLKWARAQVPPCNWSTFTSAAAAENGHLHVLKWLHSEDPPCPFFYNCCYSAAKNNQIETLTWIFQEMPKFKESIGAAVAAAGSGHINTLDFVIREMGVYSQLDRNGFSLCSAAARTNQLEVIKWLRELDPPCPWDEQTCLAAAKYGNFTLLRWLKSQNPPCPWEPSIWSQLVKCRDLEVLSWVRSIKPTLPWDTNVFPDAVVNGNLEVIKWLKSQDPPCPYNQKECLKIAEKFRYNTIYDYLVE